MNSTYVEFIMDLDKLNLIWRFDFPVWIENIYFWTIMLIET